MMLSSSGCCPGGGGLSVRAFEADDTLVMAPGDGVDWLVRPRAADGGAVQLGGVIVTIAESNRARLAAADVTIEDEEAGVIRVRAAPAGLLPGRVNWFRLRLAWPLFPDATPVVTSKLWISLI